MSMLNGKELYLFFCAAILLAGSAAGQSGGRGGREGYDTNYIGPPMADPVLQHSKETYVLFGCSYCHGLYLAARGEATDLMHSRLVGRDDNGNIIGPLLRAGIPQTAKLSPMPQFSDLSDQQIADLVRWIHYARQQGRYKELIEVRDLGPGNATRGKAYFEQTCSSCHSAGDFVNASRAQILRPKFIDAAPSWKLDRLKDTKTAARQRHLALLENYSSEDVANLMVYVQGLK